MQKTGRRGFFLSFLLVQVMAGMLYVALGSLLAALDVHVLDPALRFYPFHAPALTGFLITTGALVTGYGAFLLWCKETKGLFFYFAGKLVLGVFTMAAVWSEYRYGGMPVPWQVILVYLIMWSIFPFLLLLHYKKRSQPESL